MRLQNGAHAKHRSDYRRNAQDVNAFDNGRAKEREKRENMRVQLQRAGMVALNAETTAILCRSHRPEECVCSRFHPADRIRPL